MLALYVKYQKPPENDREKWIRLRLKAHSNLLNQWIGCDKEKGISHDFTEKSTKKPGVPMGSCCRNVGVRSIVLPQPTCMKADDQRSRSPRACMIVGNQEDKPMDGFAKNWMVYHTQLINWVCQIIFALCFFGNGTLWVQLFWISCEQLARGPRCGNGRVKNPHWSCRSRLSLKKIIPQVPKMLFFKRFYSCESLRI